MDRRTLTAEAGELFYKVLAIRTQLQLHESEGQLAAARLELARSHAATLAGNLPALEAQVLAALEAPNGARFNWTTFGYDDPPAEASAPAAAE